MRTNEERVILRNRSESSLFSTMTYEINGKQYLVIAAGENKVIREAPRGDSVVAFSLP